MGTKYGFTIEAGLTSNHLTDAQYVKGGFFVVKDRDELTRYYPITYKDDGTIDQDGTIVKGSLCYCQSEGKFYQYDDKVVDDKVVGWVEKNFSGGGSVDDADLTDYVKNMPNADKKEAELREEDGRIFCKDLFEGSVYYSGLSKKYRAYVAKPENEGGGISPNYPVELNASKVFNPYGYRDKNEMIAKEGWKGITLVEGTHYVEITHDDGSNSYHPRLSSVATRTIEGNLRTGAPRDSTDCINLDYARSNLLKKDALGSTSAIQSIGNRLAEIDGELSVIDSHFEAIDSHLAKTSVVGEWIIAQQDPEYIGNYTATTYNGGVYEWVVMMRRPIENEYWCESGICISDPTIFANAQGGVTVTKDLGNTDAKLKIEYGVNYLSISLEIEWANSVPVETAVLKMRRIRNV